MPGTGGEALRSVEKKYRIALNILCMTGLLCGWAATRPFSPSLCSGEEKGVRNSLFSLSINNEKLADVLDKMSKASGYKISVSQGWRNKTISAKLERVTVEQGIKKIVDALGRPSHFLLFDPANGKIDIVIVSEAANPSIPSPATSFRPSLGATSRGGQPFRPGLPDRRMGPNVPFRPARIRERPENQVDRGRPNAVDREQRELQEEGAESEEEKADSSDEKKALPDSEAEAGAAEKKQDAAAGEEGSESPGS